MLTLKSGQKFNRLTVLKQSGRHRYLCVCECGKEKNVSKYALVKNTTKSCGCYKGGKIRSYNETHKMSGTRPYRIWAGIKKRCNNKNFHHYEYYGGRGISYDNKWKTFEGFWEDMQDGYSEDLTIDRIDRNGNYTKENCRWATLSEQMNNHGHCKFVEINGDTKSTSDWCRYFGISVNTVYSRVQKGMTHYEAITTPIRRNENVKSISEKGCKKTQQEKAR